MKTVLYQKKTILTVSLFIFLIPLVSGLSGIVRAQEKGQSNRSVPTPVEEEKYTAAEEKSALDLLKQENPKKLEELARLQNENPELYRSAVLGEVKKLRYLEEIKRNNPEVYAKYQQIQNLELQVKQLAKEYREIKRGERKVELKVEIKNLLNKLFDLREERQLDELKQLEQKIKELGERIDRRKKDKDVIIAEKVKELLSNKKNSNPAW